MLCFSEGGQTIEIFTIQSPADGTLGAFVSLCRITVGLRAMTLHGDVLAASDDLNESQLINWRSGKYAVLWSLDEPSEHNFQVWLISR